MPSKLVIIHFVLIAFQLGFFIVGDYLSSNLFFVGNMIVLAIRKDEDDGKEDESKTTEP